MNRNETIHRFSYAERLCHWLVGVTFVLLLLSGLALSYPSLFWLTAVLGGGPAARALHPIVGLVFAAGMAWMVVLWLREMFLDRQDVAWLKAVRHYAAGHRDRVPEAGKYNAGQKLFYWLQAGLAVVFLVTGIFLWFPSTASAPVLVTMRLFHYLAGLGAGLLLIPHVYLGTVADPGTLQGMLTGAVTRGWARVHHPRWRVEPPDS